MKDSRHVLILSIVTIAIIALACKRERGLTVCRVAALDRGLTRVWPVKTPTEPLPAAQVASCIQLNADHSAEVVINYADHVLRMSATSRDDRIISPDQKAMPDLRLRFEDTARRTRLFVAASSPGTPGGFDLSATYDCEEPHRGIFGIEMPAPCD